MAIIKTGSSFHYLTYGGVSSADYGIYISGDGVYNAPTRAVELIDVPGRNGAVVMDYGRFDNIEISYPAGAFGAAEADFRKAVSDFRNAIMSKLGYQRLEDTYHPDEYREAMYISGLEVTPANMNTAGEFTLVFNCKPQRFLKSGETKTELMSYVGINNPTPFASRPMLEVYGHGVIDIEGQEITVGGTYIGDIVVAAGETDRGILTKTILFDDTYANSGDAIKISEVKCAFQIRVDSQGISAVSATESGNINLSECEIRMSNMVGCRVGMTGKQFSYGTSGTLTGSVSLLVSTDAYGDLTATLGMTISYDGSDEITITYSSTMPAHLATQTSGQYPMLITENIILTSTQTTLGSPIYIDLDIGEAYKIVNNSVVSVNNGVQLPAALPELHPGDNTIIFDNTFTKVEIIPRWWII